MTIQKQAALIAITRSDEMFRIGAADPGNYYPTSSGQKRIYFEQKSDGLEYSVQFAYGLETCSRC